MGLSSVFRPVLCLIPAQTASGVAIHLENSNHTKGYSLTLLVAAVDIQCIIGWYLLIIIIITFFFLFFNEVSFCGNVTGYMDSFVQCFSPVFRF